MRDEPTGRRIIWAFLGLLVVVGVFWVRTSNRFNSAGADPAAEITDVGPQTLTQMLSLGKPGVLEFYTANCPYCMKIAPELAELDKQYGDRLFVVKMNAEKYPSEAVKYEVQGVPTLVYFDAAGVPKAVAPGYVTFDTMVKMLRQVKLVE